jgi:hypothetical protein
MFKPLWRYARNAETEYHLIQLSVQGAGQTLGLNNRIVANQREG